jgi:hypothetical protein
MRKWVWCCTAAGVLAAGGVCAVARYACCPASALYRGLAVYAATLHPLARLSMAAGQCARGPVVAETAPQADLDDDDDVPPEPTPVSPEADDAASAIVCGPAPIVIHEEEPPPAEGSEALDPNEWHATGVLCPPATVEQAGYTQPVQEPANKGSACPMVMPYCTDEEAPLTAVPAMPHADDMPLSTFSATLFRYWLSGLGEPKEDKGGEETAEPAPADEPPNCQEDAHYHEHYSGCPYTGYHLPSQRCPVTPAGAAPARRDRDECGETPAPKKHKVNYPRKSGRGEECPKHPDVDTMEYRRSDGGLNEYGPGPF